MLLNIHVKNFALIEEAELDLKSGLNILTGETGAGKSILIDAVNAALGARIKGNVIGGYADNSYVELVFSVNEKQKELLNALEIETEYDCIIISVKITPERSVHKINDETVTAAKIRQVTDILIDIHGQHEHQSLLKESKQLEILDHFAGTDDLRAEVKASYKAFNEAKEALDGFNMDEDARIREIDFLNYEITEIENAGLSAGEEEELEDTLKKFKNSSNLAGDVGSVLDKLAEGRENAADLIASAVRYAKSASETDKSLSNLLDSLIQAEDILNDTVHEYKAYEDSLEFDPEELTRTERRLDEIHHLESKYGNGYDAIMASLSERKKKIENLTDYEVRLSEADENYNICEEKLLAACDKLSNARKAKANLLADSVKNALTELNFQDVKFEIRFMELGSPTSNGKDSICFMISANTGESIRPMAQVASGGELSRIMLGLKAVLADKDEIPTLIFDEIDTGISGRTAGMVAKKLAEIASLHQVICVTHLPQIASMADSHFEIYKKAENGHTVTGIKELDREGRKYELARLLAGENISEAATLNAAELLNAADMFKQK